MVWFNKVVNKLINTYIYIEIYADIDLDTPMINQKENNAHINSQNPSTSKLVLKQPVLHTTKKGKRAIQPIQSVIKAWCLHLL